MHIQIQQDGLALQTREADVHIVGQTGAAAAVQAGFRDVLQHAVDDVVPQLGLVGDALVQMGGGDLQGLAHGGDAGHILGACAVAGLLAAAVDQILGPDALAAVQCAHALGAKVVGVRRSVRPGAPCPDYCLRVVPQSELDAELPQADLVAMSLPGTPETLHMFDAARLARCKQGAILLNVGRGSTVDCLALADAVHSGHLFGAALDVTDPEPLPSDHPLWSEPNVIITPHISGRFSLAKTLDNIVEIFIHNLKLYAAGQPVDNQVSRTTHYVSGGSGGQRLVCGMP